MLRTTLPAALAIGALGVLASCVSDAGTTAARDAGAQPPAADASSNEPDTGTTMADSGTDAKPLGPCNMAGSFDEIAPISGASNATWFVTSPSEQQAYFANGANDDLYAAPFSNQAVSAPRALLSKAISAAAAVDTKGHVLIAFEPSGDFEVSLDWDPGPNNGSLTTSHLLLEDYTHPTLTADGTRMVVRSQGPGVGIGDRYLHQFQIAADYDKKTITAKSENVVLPEHASHPTLTTDGLAVVYVYDDLSELRYATRAQVTDSFVNPQRLAYANEILKGARPHSLSRDLCRLYFSKPTGGAFVAKRSPN